MSLVWPILAHLSAEPLVGLKRNDGMVSSKALVLSAEPLVGLKPRLHQGQAKRLDFQPNPSWV